MKFFEKYKLYRSVIKQEPNDLNVKNYLHPWWVLERICYKLNNYSICACYCDFGYYAFVLDKEGNCSANFNHLFAKRLFNHGKKYNK